MQEISHPPVRLRRLARELRQARERSGYSLKKAAGLLGWYESRLSKYELARVVPSVEVVSTLMDLYGAESGHRAALLELSRTAHHRGWWQEYGDLLSGSYVDMESEATEIREWQPIFVPGLLQTEDYARTVLSAYNPDDSRIMVERRVQAHMKREEIIAQGRRFVAVLDESVLRRIPGEIREGQLIALRESPPNVTLHVLPLVKGLQTGVDNSFVIVSFEGHPDQVYAEGPTGQTYVESADQVLRCNRLMARLMNAALSDDDSRAFIAKEVKETR